MGEGGEAGGVAIEEVVAAPVEASQTEVVGFLDGLAAPYNQRSGEELNPEYGQIRDVKGVDERLGDVLGVPTEGDMLSIYSEIGRKLDNVSRGVGEGRPDAIGTGLKVVDVLIGEAQARQDKADEILKRVPDPNDKKALEVEGRFVRYREVYEEAKGQFERARKVIPAEDKHVFDALNIAESGKKLALANGSGRKGVAYFDREKALADLERFRPIRAGLVKMQQPPAVNP